MGIQRYTKTNRLASTRDAVVFDEVTSTPSIINPTVQLNSVPTLITTSTSNPSGKVHGGVRRLGGSFYIGSLMPNSDLSVILATDWNGPPRVSYDQTKTWTKLGELETGIGTWDNYQLGAYGNGTFVLVGNNSNAVRYSTDNGATWTLTTLSVGTSNWSSLVFYKGKFLMSSSTIAGYIMSSSDGITWTQVAIPTVSGAGGWKITALGYNYAVMSAKNNNYIMHSSNLVDWTAVNAGQYTYGPSENSGIVGSTAGGWLRNLYSETTDGIILLPIYGGFLAIQENDINNPVNYGAVGGISNGAGESMGSVTSVKGAYLFGKRVVYISSSDRYWIAVYYWDSPGTGIAVFNITYPYNSHMINLPVELTLNEWLSVK